MAAMWEGPEVAETVLGARRSGDHLASAGTRYAEAGTADLDDEGPPEDAETKKADPL